LVPPRITVIFGLKNEEQKRKELGGWRCEIRPGCLDQRLEAQTNNAKG